MHRKLVVYRNSKHFKFWAAAVLLQETKRIKVHCDMTQKTCFETKIVAVNLGLGRRGERSS